MKALSDGPLTHQEAANLLGYLTDVMGGTIKLNALQVDMFARRAKARRGCLFVVRPEAQTDQWVLNFEETPGGICLEDEEEG